jgi:hypothetical protein
MKLLQKLMSFEFIYIMYIMISLLPKLAVNYAYTRGTYQKLYAINTEKTFAQLRCC